MHWQPVVELAVPYYLAPQKVCAETHSPEQQGQYDVTRGTNIAAKAQLSV